MAPEKQGQMPNEAVIIYTPAIGGPYIFLLI